jgi:hypothetical protein
VRRIAGRVKTNFSACATHSPVKRRAVQHHGTNRLGPLFQTQVGKLQLNANLIFEQHYRSDTSQRADLSYQWQAKYRWQPKFGFGVQGFGDVGLPNHWDAVIEASHRMGPAIFGKFDLGNHRAIRYNAAWLAGTSSNAPNNNIRTQVEYEF